MTSKQKLDSSNVGRWLASHSGISASIIGSHSLERAIGQRLKITGLDNTETYLELLLESSQEQQCLVELVVVPETWFFRDRQPFIQLRKHMQALIAGGLPSQPLQLLSAPCASGEEPYSLAMTLLDMGLPADCFRIDAVDICRQSIRKARQAVYGKHSFRGVSEAEKAQNFQTTPQGLALHPAIRNIVHFKCANLMSCLAETATHYDVIFCRNLLIYLEEAASQHLLQSLASLMKPGALLIVGSAETGKVPSSLFSPIRESFVFGFLRQDEPPDLPQKATAASLPDLPSRRRERPERAARPACQPQALESAARRDSLRSAAAAATAAAQAVERRTNFSDKRGSADEVDKELEQCQQELARNPYSDATYLRLGQLLERRNQTDEALACLQKCLYLKPNSREALEAMIQLTKQLGQVERSRQFQGRLARMVP
ncbi:MAG: hypothetical protein NTV57_12165 [Cyanobacteria bacterium]|nr:hypothetical protein [Cyanobacteriota bacterium]